MHFARLFAWLAFAATVSAAPVEMKILLLTATGEEPSYLAIRSALDHLGTPYKGVLLAKGEALPALDDGEKGFYQAVILSTGNLGVCDPGCRSALSAEEWSRLDAYAAAFAVRTVGFYSFPDSRFGLRYVEGVFSPLAEPSTAEFTTEAGPVFSYLRQEKGLRIAGAFAYLAEPAPAPGETTTPILRLNDRTIGAIHFKPDGREYLALTFDHSPALRHSLQLTYGVIAWATKGVFLGSRRVYLTPQSDDLFLPNNLFTAEGPCATTQFLVNPTAPLAPNCPKVRIDNQDLVNLRDWQSMWTRQPQTAKFRTTMAFNGMGAKTDDEDPLTAEARRSLGDFYWVSHTFTHKILDCYGINADGSCRPANYDEGADEIQRNLATADRLELPVDRPSLVTPAVSGLTNVDFLRAAADSGIRYLVSDTSRPEGNPAIPNTGIHPPSQPGLLFIPRRATAIFYNTSTAEPGMPGSLPDEYNFFFGPDGIMRVGGVPEGPPFFDAHQNYSQIVERESEALVNYMWRYEKYPSMFHQSNFYSYDGTHSLFSDTLDAALRKFTAASSLPVISLAQTDIGKLLGERMAWLECGARVILVPGESITITVEKAATVPLTGVCGDNCEEYGGEMQSRVPVEPGVPVTVMLPRL